MTRLAPPEWVKNLTLFLGGLIVVVHQILIRDCIKKTEKLEKHLVDMTKKRDILSRNYQNLLKEKTNLVKNCDSDKVYLSEQITQLASQLADALMLPDVTPFTENYEVFDPWTEGLPVDDSVMADLEYHVYPKEDWLSILKLVQPNVKAVLIRWRREIADCDTWALLMAGLVSGCFAKAGLSRQGAFMVAWSRKHAYNVYRDSDGDYWVYEPQSNKTVCKLEDAEDQYVTRKLWLMS